MSDKDHNDSSHEHDHAHGHHEHDHSHGHEHGHEEHDHIQELLEHKQESTAPDPEIISDVDDPSTRALAEALRSSFAIVKVILVVLVLVFLSSGVFQVKENESAVVLRLGKPVATGTDVALRPGLHWAFPYPIDEIVKIPLGQSHSVTSKSGWPAIDPTQEIKGDQGPAGPESLRPGVDGYTLTSDGNIIHVKATLKYRISDPVRYTFDFEDAPELLKGILDNAIFYTSAHFTAESALYGDKEAFREMLANRVQSMVEKYNLGVTLEPIIVEQAPPGNVRPAYEAVQQSDLERNQKVNAAHGDAEKMLREAKGDAQALISAGISDSNQLVQAVRAEAVTFKELLPLYRVDPELFRQRVMTEKLQLVMTNAQDKFYLPSRADGAKRELRLQLNREPVKPKGNP